tara:strand:+ start:27284 stop:28003 length:720 start_codon:yes stop_codon:yes gene_type:complete
LIYFLIGWIVLTNFNIIFNLSLANSSGQLELLYLCIFGKYLYAKHDGYVFNAICNTLMMYYFFVFVTDPFIDYVPIWAIVLENLIIVLILLYQFNRNKNFKADKYNADNVMLIFFKPHSFLDFIKSFFFSPVVSMGSIINGEVFRLKWSKAKMQSTKLNKRHLSKDYILIDTGVKCKDVKGVRNELLKQSAFNNKLFNTRTNCIRSQKPLLDKLGKKWQTKDIWDLFPMIYLSRRLKGR